MPAGGTAEIKHAFLLDRLADGLLADVHFAGQLRRADQFTVVLLLCATRQFARAKARDFLWVEISKSFGERHPLVQNNPP